MRKFATILGMLALAGGLHAQITFTDDFESYNVGDYIGQVSPDWTTWSGTTGGAEDAQVVNTQANSGTKSAYWVSSAPGGGPQDVILPFGGEHNTGTFVYSMSMFVTSGKGAYWNFQANSTPGVLWALECYMNQNGVLTLSNTSGTYLTTNYPTGQWFDLEVNVNLNTNRWELRIDNVLQGVFSNPVNQVASIDIYGANPTAGGGNDQAEFWVDDVAYTYTPYVLPNLNAAVVSTGGINPATLSPGNVTGLVGQQKVVAATVRNLGLTPITSFHLDYAYNGNTGQATVTGVNIPSLGTMNVTFTTPITLVAGTQVMNATVNQVNGQISDDDPNDDTANRTVAITAVPAADKVVVAEEGTGTWCQWCPRGAVYMDYMHDTYDGYFAPIAVHNNDPMEVTDYDTPFSGFLSGYPSVLVERGTEVDPLDVEADFLTKIVVAPTATIGTGATWNALTRELNVSLTYTFANGADNSWRVACVLTEDSVTGGAGYNQANAYGNNGAGPMGGFENLSTNVPASQMNYNHVARAMSPNFLGAAPFPTVVATGDIFTYNFSFTLPATWDENQLHIVGMLIDNGGEIDNGSFVNIDEAVAAGFVAGEVIVGVEQPEGPDAVTTLYPNPTHDNAWISLNLDADTDVQVTVSDLQGRTLATRDYGILNGTQQIQINTQGYAQGIYLVQVRMGDVLKTQRLVVE